MAHTFCPLPWKHLSTQANGDLRVCCQCITAPFGKAVKADGTFFNGARDDDREVRNTAIFKEIRRAMVKGERSRHCELCWTAEDLGHASRRKDELELMGPEFEKKALNETAADGTIDVDAFPVTHFDLRLGNTCNFRCRSCSPRDSSAWYDDYAKMKLEDSLFRKTPPKFDDRYEFVQSDKGWKLDTNDFSWHEESVLLARLEENLGHVERIYFTGGEPTLIRAHWRLLEQLIEKDRAKHIWLDYNTNASSIKPEWLTIWSKFRHVFLGCSVDAIGDKAVYLRPPVEWDTIERNLTRIAMAGGSIHAGICVTVSAYNVFHYLEILEYMWDKKWPNFHVIPFGQVLEYPDFMSVQVLPLHVKQLVRKRYNDFFKEKSQHLHPVHRQELRAKFDYILSYMDGRDRSGDLKAFLRKTDQMDRLRGQNFRETFPELAGLLLR